MKPYLVLWILATPTQKLTMRECTKQRWFWNLLAFLAIPYNAEYSVDLGHVDLTYIKLVYCYLSLNLYIHSDIHLDFGRICSELGMNLRMKILCYVSAR